MTQSSDKFKISRRKFLGQASCAGLGALTFMNTFINLRAINAATISNASINTNCQDYKAIVCILKAGGNDSFNMLMPHDVPRYNVYAATRSGLAIPRAEALPLTLSVPDPINSSYQYSIHPSLSNCRSLFNDQKMAFLTNVGTLLVPNTTKQMYHDNLNMPIGLFSHADQIQQWQTGIPSERTSKGWGGKIADIVQSCNGNQNISMNVTLSGSNIFLTGNQTIEYAIDPYSGSVGISGYDPESTWLVNQSRVATVDNYMEHIHQDIFKRTFTHTRKNALDAHLEFQNALQGSVVFDPNLFPDSYFGNQLHMIARTIDIQDDLDFNRQIFFVTYGGWDHHDEVLNNQIDMFGDVDAGLGAFMTALEQIGMADKVLTMTISEFGRTLTWNGNGSDHAWGGNVMVMGGPNLINGGRIYGQYPDLSLNNPIEIGSGVLIPSLSTDEYFAEVAKWFGVSPMDLNIIFPNLHEFYSTTSSQPPIGFLNI